MLRPIAPFLAALTLLACNKPEAAPPAAPAPAPAATPAPAPAPEAEPDPAPSAAERGPRVVKTARTGTCEVVTGIAAGPAEQAIADEMSRAAAAARRAVVYIGAPWCAPCVRFKKALLAGELEGILPGVRLLEFDNDLDGDRLRAAGYKWRLVPMFAVPDHAGRPAGLQTAGVPGKDAPMAPLGKRVAELLDKAGRGAGARPAPLAVPATPR